MFKIVSFLALGMLPVSFVSLASPAQAAGRSGKKSAAAVSARAYSAFPNVQKALHAGDYAAAQTAVVDALAGIADKEGREARRLSAALEVIRTASPDVMSAMHRAGKGAFLQAFLGDTEWMELYLGSGMVPFHNDVGLGILADIWALDGKSADFNAYKPLACALASVWGGEEGYKPVVQTKSRSTHNPVWRYQFFKNRSKAGVLYPGFERLRPWELRFVVGIPQQDWDDQSYAWCAENINIPWQRYNAACWAAPYTDPNVFGDGVQTPDYYIGWPDESDAQKTQLNGGVCGGLSHFGTVSAQAHGIPAYTVGQPGHCAYAVRLERGKWIGGFGGPDGGMHNWIFSKGQAPTSFRLMEAVFADDKKIDAAYRQSFRARALEAMLARKEADAAWKGPDIGVQDVAKAWEEAVRLAPLHPHFRRELQRWLERSGMQPDAWLVYALETMRCYKEHGFAAIEALENVADKVMPQLSEAQRLEWLAASQACLAETPGSWALKLDPVLNKQMGYLQSDEGRRQYLADLFSAHMRAGDGANFGAALEWGVRQFVDKGREKLFADAFQKAAASSGAGERDKARAGKMAQAYRKAILAAEKARSIPAFQTLTTAAAAMAQGEKRDIVKSTLPGTLVSDKGALRFSSNSGAYDKPETHGGILTRQGGSYHSEREKTVEAVVALPKVEEIAGIIVRKTDGNEWRMKKATLSTSTDGATWFPLASTNDMPKEWVVEAAPGSKAGWVKLEFHNDGDQGEFAHISNFLIYKR